MSKITAEEQAAIDAFLAENTVTELPPGASSHKGYQWTGNRLELVDPADNALATCARRKRGKAKCPKVAARRMKVKDMLQSGMTAREVSAALGVTEPVVRQDAREVGHVFDASEAQRKIAQQKRKPAAKPDPAPQEPAKASPAPPPEKPKPSKITPVDLRKGPRPHVAARREKVREMHAEGMSQTAIAKKLEVSQQVISLDARVLGIKFSRAPRKNAGDAQVERKAAAAKTKSGAVRDRRRFKTVPVPMGDPSVMANRNATATIFPGRVFEPSPEESLLKDGCNASKIGGDVLVGWLKGARIYTLTLEERATCPRACAHWQSCYGNSMPHARRWRHGPELVNQLEREITDLCQRHERVLIRLHVLGDFWSVEYVDFWARALERHANLFVFGFTAHKPGTKIGDFIAAVRGLHPDRFWMRHSGMTGPWGTFTVDFPTQQKRIGDAIVCPEQRDGMEGGPKGRHCGNCGVCWSTAAPIVFITH